MIERDQIARDLKEHLGREVQAVAHRHLRVAETVLTSNEIVRLGMGVALSMTLSMIGMCAGFVDGDEAQEAVFDLCAAALRNGIMDRKDELIRRVAAEQAKERRR